MTTDEIKKIPDITQMVNPAMKLMEELTKDIFPQNKVSKFIEEHVGAIFAGETDMASGFIVKMMVDESNKTPELALQKFLTFYNAFGEFYADISEPKDAEN